MAKHRIYTTSFASVYPHYVAKAEKKGRTKAEVDQIIGWLTGYGPEALAAELEAGTDFESFFAQGAADEPGAGGDHGRGLRRSGRDDRGAADAGDPLPRQAGRRAGAGEADGGDFAGRVRGQVRYCVPGINAAPARDAVKKEALRKAGIGYHEVVAGATTPSELRRLVEKLVPEVRKAG